MISQLEFLPAPPPRQRHSQTSAAAAQAIEPEARTLRGRVLRFLKERGAYGATDEELQHWLKMDPSTERPRRIELVRMGLVSKSEFTRTTSSGRRATVWRAT